MSRIGRLGILPRRGHKIVATGGTSVAALCRRHRRGTRGIRAKIPYGPGRGDRDCRPCRGYRAMGPGTTGCAWPDCRRTALHPWLQSAAPPGLNGQNLRITARDVVPGWANSAPSGHYPACQKIGSSVSRCRPRQCSSTGRCAVLGESRLHPEPEELDFLGGNFPVFHTHPPTSTPWRCGRCLPLADKM